MALSEIQVVEREYECAADGYRQVLASDPASSMAETGLGQCCQIIGQYSEAAACFENLLGRGVRSLPVIAKASQIPTRFSSADWLNLLKEVRKGDTEDKSDFENSVAFVKAAMLHRAGRHGDAWQLLVSANRCQFLARREAWERQRQDEDISLAQARESVATVMGGRPGEGRSAVSLFILGPSRSGKTLLEQLTSSLGCVKRGYENPIVENAVRRAYQSAGYLASRRFVGMSAAVEALCRNFYLDELQRRGGRARVFTNTDPDRIHEAVRIAEIIPNVRFLLVKRDPDDLALRMFMTKYAAGNAHAYDLATIRGHAAWYHQFIDVIAAKYPAISRVIHYEEMIASPLKTRAEVAGLCGLETAGGPMPGLGDDRGCAAPYLVMMN